MNVTAIRHDWPEKPGFHLHRINGRRDYTFLHFHTPVQLRLNGTLIQTRPDACIFFGPDVPQFFRSDEGIVHNWLHADPSLGTQLKKYGIPENQLMYPHSASFISRLFAMIEAEYFSENSHKKDLIDGYVNEFLIRLSRSLENNPGREPDRADRKKLGAVRQTVLSQPEKQWTVPEMAALAALSPSRFHAIYKTLFGTSPMQDVIEARISYAKSLLLTNRHMTLPAIAELLGYNDQYHFIRQFKALTGTTPGAFRNNAP